MITFGRMNESSDPSNNSSNGEFSGGFVRRGGKGRPPRVKHPPLKNLPNADPTLAQERVSAAIETGSQHPNNARKTKLAVLGIPSTVLNAGSPEYARCVKLAKAYKNARTKEIFNLHGYVSSGASALLAAASLALSASRFLYEIAASTPIRPAGDDRGLSMPQILKLASSLSDSARQNELSAWELAAREAVVKRRNDQNSAALPWVSSAQESTALVRRGPGRPRKVELAKEETDATTIILGQTEGSGSDGL